MNKNASRWYDNALLVNRDADWWTSFCQNGFTEGGHPMNFETPETTAASLKRFIHRFAGYKITDLLIDVSGQLSAIPSKVMMWYGDKWMQKSENGIPVDYSDYRYKDWYRIFIEHGVDALQVMLDQVKEDGMRPWISFRMNDCHFPFEETAFLRSDFFYYARDKGYMIGSKHDYGYYGICFDYSQAEVRKLFLDYIEECLGKYDVFGVELDFVREVYCFDYIHKKDCASIMNGFIREARAIVNAAGERYGHPIRLMIRVPRSIESALGFGFDCRTWVKEDLVDALVPTPRWACTDSGIPVGEWKTMIGDKEIAVFPGLEVLNLNQTITYPDQARGYAAAWFAEGGDGIYTYNYFGYPSYRRDRDVWMLDRESCVGKSRRFTVTWQDLCPAGIEPYRPLPLTVDEKAELELAIGAVNAGDRVDVTLAWKDGSMPALTLNGEKPSLVCPFAMDEREVSPFTGAPVKRTDCTEAAVYSFDTVLTDNRIVLAFEGRTEIGFVELDIIAGGKL